MKKKLTLILLSLTALSLSAHDWRSPFQLDAGAGLSFGLFEADDFPNESEEFAEGDAIFLSILSIRGGVNGTARYYVTDHISLGAELGINYLSLSNNDTGDEYLLLEVPMRAVVRLGSGKTFIQGFGGYYWGVTEPIFGGTEVGAKLSLGGFYMAASYVMGDMCFPRFELGACFNNLLR